jgi:hypothetical protein
MASTDDVGAEGADGLGAKMFKTINSLAKVKKKLVMMKPRTRDIVDALDRGIILDL